MEEGVEGFSFKSEDVDDLKRVMMKCLSRKTKEYNKLVEKMSLHVNKEYAIEAIVSKYLEMFNRILKK